MDSNTIEIWKFKRLLQKLQEYRGNGTSMISLILPPGSQISLTHHMLTEEYGTATNIKSRVNRLSVLNAITSAQQCLKRYPKVPPNGLLLYCGTIITPEGKEKKVSIDIEPFRPINTSLYMCDQYFHIDGLRDLMDDQEVFGFIIMNGDGCLYGTVHGNTRTILYQFSVQLPKKHGRGGQSSVRFARQRLEARHNYLHKVAELATQYFITDDRCNVKGLVLAGSADFKTELSKSDLFDPRLHTRIIQIVDVAYGGQSGFHQAIQLSAASLENVRMMTERRLCTRFMNEIYLDTGKYCFGIMETIKALEMGAVEILLVWEQFPLKIQIVQQTTDQKEIAIFQKDDFDPTTMNHIENISFVDWIAQHYGDYGTQLEFITDSSPEGTQFVKGFGGIGGILRWKCEWTEEEENTDLLSFSDEDDFFI